MPAQLESTEYSVAVIIVNFNGGLPLSRCIEALERQTFRGFRMIVVDNASTDASADALESRFPRLTVLRPGKNLGFAAGSNLGSAAAAGCKWVVLLNPDAFPEPDCLGAMLLAAEAHPGYAMFQARLVIDGARSLVDGVGDVMHVSGIHWREGHMQPIATKHDRPREVFSPCAAAAMYQRDAFESAGGFDEDFFCYAEDLDLGFRLRLAGHRAMYVPGAVVYHVGSGITGRRSDFSVYHGQRNLVWTFAKDMPAALALAYLPLHIAMNVASIFVLALRGQSSMHCEGCPRCCASAAPFNRRAARAAPSCYV
jgi:GT2 family glycosyltransferase